MMTYLILATLAVCGTALFTGVMVAVGYILGPYWTSLSSVEFLSVFEQMSSNIRVVMPLVIVPSLIGLFGSTWSGRNMGSSVRLLWAASTACTLLVLVATAVWFLPQNAQFIAGTLSPEQVMERLHLWLMLHHGRVGFALGSSVLAISALIRSLGHPKETRSENSPQMRRY